MKGRGVYCSRWWPVLLMVAVLPATSFNSAIAGGIGTGLFGEMLSVASVINADSVSELQTCEAALDSFTSCQYSAITIHKTFAFTTAGLLLAADGMGLYHFLKLQQRGHAIRDRIGFTEASGNTAPQTDGIRQVWRDGRSQTERVIHTGLIVLGALSYTATATIELTMPRTSKSSSPVSSTRLHRKAFYLHAGLMAANIALGLVESAALSKGNHNVVQGVGIAHLVVGFSVPVVILGAGGIFKLPLDY